jgi:hypothetical protein
MLKPRVEYNSHDIQRIRKLYVRALREVEGWQANSVYEEWAKLIAMLNDLLKYRADERRGRGRT